MPNTGSSAGAHDSQFGFSTTRTVPIDFVVTLTSVYSSTAGYAWSELRGSPGNGFAAPVLPRTGDQAYEVSGRTDLAIGSICRMFMDRDQTVYGLAVIEEGNGSGGVLECEGCGWVAALDASDCLLVSVVAAVGACACAVGGGEAYLTSTDGETWGGSSGGDVVNSCCPSNPTPAILHGTSTDARTVTLVWNGSNWGGTDSVGDTITLFCASGAGNWELTDSSADTQPVSGLVCSPFSGNFVFFGSTWTITE